MTTLTIESLQTENTTLRGLLQERAIIAHALARTLSHIKGDVPEHRGEFYNCPSPECAEVRTALGKQDGAL